MEQQMVLISATEVDRLLVLLQRAEGYCTNARPSVYPIPDEDLHADCTEFYSGASGYAKATMREVIQCLESAR